ncbi:MAG TPA: enoyl-CoA hydratase/isomerase family protein, partial [Ilumatobacteraceae bacterium]
MTDATDTIATSGAVSLSTEAGVATLLLTRPERANAMDAEFFRAVGGALEVVAADESVRVVVLAGEGRHFCAGGDLRHPLFDDPDPRSRRRQIEAAYDVTNLMLDLDVPIVSALHGRIAGAATAMVLATDIRVAAPSTVFSLDFVRLGLSPDMGVCYLLAPAVGTGRALEMALTGDLVDAEKALAWGLVSRVVEEGRQREAALDVAMQLLEHPRGGMGSIRRLIRQAPFMDRAAGFDAEITSINRLIPSD